MWVKHIVVGQLGASLASLQLSQIDFELFQEIVVGFLEKLSIGFSVWTGTKELVEEIRFRVRGRAARDILLRGVGSATST